MRMRWDVRAPCRFRIPEELVLPYGMNQFSIFRWDRHCLASFAKGLSRYFIILRAKLQHINFLIFQIVEQKRYLFVLEY